MSLSEVWSFDGDLVNHPERGKSKENPVTSGVGPDGPEPGLGDDTRTRSQTDSYWG